jgi:hypothetical protein
MFRMRQFDQKKAVISVLSCCLNTAFNVSRSCPLVQVVSETFHVDGFRGMPRL